MRKKKKTLVIGGGIVGIVASYLMAIRNKNVVLVEAAPQLGGLLRGPSFDGRHFDNGTHLLSSTGVPEIDEFLLSDFSTDQFNFFHGHDADRSGSFSMLGWNENTSFVDIRPEGIAADIIEWRRSNEVVPIVSSAYDELYSLYGYKAVPFFGQVLSSVYGRDPRELGVNAVKQIALHRTVLMSNDEIEAYSDFAKISSVIAHPDRAHFNRKLSPNVRSLYPKARGLGLAIDRLEAKLKRAGVQILKSTTLKRSGSDFIVISPTGVQSIPSPHVIWTAGVPAAANLFLKKKFDTVSGDLVCWIAHVELSKKLRQLNNYYYFVRRPSMRTYRLTNYCAITLNNSDQGYTLEITAPRTFSETDMAELVKRELLIMGLIEFPSDVNFMRLNRFNYSFLNATTAFESWCETITEELREHMPMFGPWSSRGMFFTGDCLRDLYARLPK
jgi:protoporphyrinogen oxidase